jgi:hypothetical protein
MRGVLLWSAALSCMISTAASASIISYDNFGPENTYSQGGNWMGNGEPYDVGMFVGTSFNLSTGGNLSLIECGMEIIGQVPNQITLSIRQDNADMPGGTIWSETFTGALPSSYGNIAMFSPQVEPSLLANTKYWLTAQVPLDGFRPYTWDYGLNGVTSVALYEIGTGVWTVYDNETGLSLRAFVDVPEPSSVAAFGLLFVLGGTQFRSLTRRHKI